MCSGVWLSAQQGMPPGSSVSQFGLPVSNNYPLPVLLRAVLAMEKQPKLALNRGQKSTIYQALVKVKGCDLDIESLRSRMKKVLTPKQLNYINILKKSDKLVYSPTQNPEIGKNPIVSTVLELLKKKAGSPEKAQ